MVRRYLTGVLVAVVLVLTVAHVAGQVLIPDPCKDMMPSDWEYWMFSCWLKSGLADFGGFIVR
jgi:hypothetical protein